MIELARDPDLQRRLIAAGSARGAMFSWEVAAERTWRVLETAATLKGPPGSALRPND